jgi:hypothetical protein
MVISIAPAGGRYASKKTFAPHVNITIVMQKGITVHSNSSASDAHLVLVTATMVDGRDHQHCRDEQREEGGDRHHEEVQAVDLRRLR